MPEPTPRPTLEQKLYAFVSRLSDGERIDDLRLSETQRNAERADLFLANRSIVGEVKTVSKDTSEKVETILKPYMETEAWPMFYMTWPWDEIVSRLPDADALKRRIYDAVTSAVPELVRKANRQIRTTKETFRLSTAHGLLIVLNDLVGILDPGVLAYSIRAALSKRHPDRSLQFPEVNCVWILSETHIVRIGATRGSPAVLMRHPVIEDLTALEYVKGLQPQWAAFNGLPLVSIPQEHFNELQFETGVLVPEPEAPITLSEHWRRAYRARPYLRSLSEDELLRYGAKLATESGNLFLIGSPSRHNERVRSAARFGDFIEELNFRKIDLRRMKPYNEATRIFLPARIAGDLKT